ncbi:endonuclease/exonuclease/phosphatase family protein [Commensalibacter oyaizuii]|uniref:Endonuclease/exonuclease/phosphatase family protein n=1 Tax=Commensalibacter oyaizuii TaxID=3043873 RepID=A0ABT6PZH6_9PROT|nr:endonuclease/exonuclease/phosphatase family protein [Commensalibacter sp. TBRC 16381]MDI2090262.1 endonuclease/exonuclease/phosphatase family protein [Commensalibacter sp. TBRC 16381]
MSQSNSDLLNPNQPDFNHFKVISWNLLRKVGATPYDVAYLVNTHQPDLLLMQEATEEMNIIPQLLGGYYSRFPLPGRIHGVACWSPYPFNAPPSTCVLPKGALIRRVAQLIDYGKFWIANVHLSHGQILNRRQLQVISDFLPDHAAVLGDYNLVGPVLLSGFEDVGPREPTHKMINLFPIRLDRCLVRGMECIDKQVLSRSSSDHCPIMVTLRPHDL